MTPPLTVDATSSTEQTEKQQSPLGPFHTLAQVVAARQQLKRDYETAKKSLRAEYKISLQMLERAERVVRNDRSVQLERLSVLESKLVEHFAEAHVRNRVSTKSKPEDSPKLRAFRQAWRSPRSREDYDMINALIRSVDPRGWTKVAKRCGIPFAVTLYRNEVAHVLGYSLSGVDKLRKQGVLPYLRASYRLVTFLPKDIRIFIKNTRKWKHRTPSKQNLSLFSA